MLYDILFIDDDFLGEKNSKDWGKQCTETLH